MTTDLRAIRDAANKFAAHHLRECAVELEEWDNTAILRDGKVRELALMVEPFAGDYHALRIASSIVQKAALKYVINNS